jgi:hypothetical protein
MTSPLLTKEEVIKLGKINSAPYSVLAKAYMAMANNSLSQAKLYHSDIVFMRYALWKRTGYWIGLDRVEAAARAEGWKEVSKRKY